MTIVRIHVAVLIGFVAVLLDPATAAAATSADGFVGQSARIVIFILGGIAIAAVAAAAIEVTFRTVREGKWSSDTAPVLSALTAQRYYTRVLYGIAPAAVASAIALVRGAEVSAVIFLFARDDDHRDRPARQGAPAPPDADRAGGLQRPRPRGRARDRADSWRVRRSRDRGPDRPRGPRRRGDDHLPCRLARDRASSPTGPSGPR